MLRLEHACESPGGFIKAQVAGCTPKVPDSVGLGGGPKVCFSNMQSGDAAAGPESTLWKQLLVQMSSKN